MGEKKSIKNTLQTVGLILALIVIIVMAYYIYTEKTNTDKQISTFETNAITMQNTINDLQQKVNDNSNTNDNESNITNSENLVTELKLGSYQVTEHIEDEVGIVYDGVGVTLASNNLCSVYEGYGSSYIGTYSIENNKMICNTIICRGQEGGIGYSEGNIIFEFEIIGKEEIKLVNVINNSNNTYNDIALKFGMTYKLSDANIKVLIDND